MFIETSAVTLQDVMISILVLTVALFSHITDSTKFINRNKLTILSHNTVTNNIAVKQYHVSFIPLVMHGSAINLAQYELGAVPKKKPSHRRTRIRRVAWMKRNPITKSLPTMVDLADMLTYTSGTYTKARTTRQNWLNLPNTRLTKGHFIATELSPPL